MPTPAEIPRGWGVLAYTPRDDYFEFWNRIRAQAPVIDAGEGVILVSGREPVDAALRDPRLRAGSGVSQAFGGPGSPVDSVVRNWLMSQDGDPHRRARALVARLFTPAAVARLEPVIRACARRLVDDFLALARERPADFVENVALRLPSEVVRQLFAIAPAEWALHVEPLFIGKAAAAADGFAAVQGLAAYFHAHGATPHGGIIDELRAPDRRGERLSEAEVIANAVLIVTAGVDTTAGTLANTLLRLLEHPACLARVVADPACIPAAVEEALRHCPAAPSTTRRAIEPLELGGVSIPAGSDLFLSLAAANRDPACFADADRFLPERADAGALATFGGGAHFCLGATLARAEARILFEELFAAATRFELRAPLRWRVNNPSVRMPVALMVCCEPAGPRTEVAAP